MKLIESINFKFEDRTISVPDQFVVEDINRVTVTSITHFKAVLNSFYVGFFEHGTVDLVRRIEFLEKHNLLVAYADKEIAKVYHRSMECNKGDLKAVAYELDRIFRGMVVYPVAVIKHKNPIPGIQCEQLGLLDMFPYHTDLDDN